MGKMSMIWKVLTRKKVIDPVTAEETQLSRVLSTFDLTALGVGSTLGVGVYVLAGHVAKEVAGPAVVLSFFLAAIASVFAGLCYAEFGARAPKAGSAYIYSYVCVGEFIAFVIGWNLILEYVIGSASVARGLSLYLDTLINGTLQNTFEDIAPINVPYLSSYFDFLAFGISVLLSVALAFGMKQSSYVNNGFTILNIFVVGFVVIAGSLKADPANWSISPDQNGTNSTAIGNGGFFPFGVEGMIKGAATCFYGFVGFDCIATTGEEVKNPKRAIPISIILSLFIIFLAYFGTSTVITLMVPYYLQDPDAPIPHAFAHIGWYTAKWIVSIGGIFGLCASLFGAMFPLPRIIYAMANDSLVFKFLGRVNSRFQTPVIGTLVAGLLTGLMAAMFELAQLVNMMSIGTLLAYTIVAASVLLLRYAREEVPQYMPVQTTSDSDDSETYTENKTYNNLDDATTSEEQDLLKESGGSVLGQIFNCGRYRSPTKVSEKIVTAEVFIYCVICILIGLCAIYLKNPIADGEIWAIVLTSVIVFLAAVIIMSMVTQPTSNKELSFKVPLVPLIPALSILVNIYLMLNLDPHTWVRFGVWMAIGLPIYYFSVRPYKEAQNKNVSNKSSINNNITMVHSKQNGNLNGISNKAFVDDETVRGVDAENGFGSKKRPAPQPPNQSNGYLDNEISVEITKLDEILDEAANAIDNNAIERKLSVDTMSNASELVSREENVIAVVHRDNVITPANSHPSSLSSDKKDSLPSSNEPLTFKIDNNNIENVQTENASAPILVVQNEIQNEAPNEDTNASSENNLEPVVNGVTPAIEDKSNLSPVQNESYEAVANFAPPPPPLPPLSDTITLYKNEGAANHLPVPPSQPPPLPLPPPRVEEEKNDETLPSKNINLPVASQTLHIGGNAVVRPTSSNLRSVTLRPTKYRGKSKDEEEEDEKYVPGEENLKPGTEQYKHFLENLGGKLQKPISVPSFIPYVRKTYTNPASPTETKRQSNEDVIDDNINTSDAAEKLSSFISDPTRNKGILGQIDRILSSDKSTADDEEPTKDEEVKGTEIVDNEIYVADPKDVQRSLSSGRVADNDFMEHKNRMQNVFRSMNLKKMDSFKDPNHVENRNVKSLGHNFVVDDKTKHRQAMGEIFKSINLRRKDSQK
ncbi:hypothetical protein NQ315_005203 [Exocentrus adspersus]|uniref:Cationic amino acid transporter C-terminal domain-containing protein n=1 Tax=Exocentrus adspersus TaxID=1586481 RepID=A0AAV8VUT6_9CUCU|nr:hypothetical protein NQ315_005203 [Exocentrus adspersus]